MSDEVLAWLSVWNEMQMICIWSNLCHCHSIMSCFIKIHIGLIFLVLACLGCTGKEAVKCEAVYHSLCLIKLLIVNDKLPCFECLFLLLAYWLSFGRWHGESPKLLQVIHIRPSAAACPSPSTIPAPMKKFTVLICSGTSVQQWLTWLIHQKQSYTDTFLW